jgi:hypothetical protein
MKIKFWNLVKKATLKKTQLILIFAEHTSKNGLKYKRYKGLECGNCPKKS